MRVGLTKTLQHSHTGLHMHAAKQRLTCRASINTILTRLTTLIVGTMRKSQSALTGDRHAHQLSILYKCIKTGNTNFPQNICYTVRPLLPKKIEDFKSI